jgi:DNA polymerase III alpha subunit
MDTRTIITKSGTKMAFMKLEDKTSEAEVIVFPSTYAEIGAKLQTDAILRISGKISARDKEGNLKTEAQLIAEEIFVVTDEELESYESTGRRMDEVKAGSKPSSKKTDKVVSQKASSGDGRKFTSGAGEKKSFSKNTSNFRSKSDSSKPTSNPARSAENYEAEKLQKVSFHINFKRHSNS